ncbi:MAG: carbohydrate binding family 9 domain-containing protein, partial [Rhodospirillaceae bacterium]|nr:carbohydrate binding family 9 domain-containing protein [Rhodospirillaceae bacterium]
TLAIALCVFVQCSGSLGQEHPGAAMKTMEMRRLPGAAPVIDGRLDEAVWENATVVDDLHQIDPIEYQTPTDPTRILVFYDDDALYVGARMPQTLDVVGTVLRQGQEFWSDDFLSLIIDTFNDKRNGYRFQVNPNGVRMEAIYENTTATNWDWTGIWRAAATEDDAGWTAEMAIPFKTLSFNPDNDTWGINFTRDVGRTNETSGWVSRNNNTNPSIAGEAAGFTNLQLGRGLDVVPSVVLEGHRTVNPETTDYGAEPSLDVYYKVTPSLNASLTLNTDFSATEVDDRQVEFTRFNLFFPEKRDFFLRDSDIFQFGQIGFIGNFGVGLGYTFSRPDLENGQPYFSRRIGLSQAGRPVDLTHGGKLAGRIGRWNVGALAIRQDEFEGVEGTDILVARAAANVLEESTVGIIVTDGDPRSNRDNTLAGVDFRYSNTQLPGGRVLEADAWYQRSRTDGIHVDGDAYGFRVRAPNRTGFLGSLGSKTIEENFYPALGFVNRSGIRNHTANFGYIHRFRNAPIRTAYWGIDAERMDLIEGGLQTQVLTLRAFEFDTDEQFRGHAYLSATREVLARPFVVWRRGDERVVIPAGDYSFDGAEFQFGTSFSRPVWAQVNYSPGDFYGGERQRVSTTFGWRPSRHFVTNLGYQYNDVTLPYGEFTTRLVRFSAEMVFSSRLSLVTLLQYDDISESMGINARLHWVPQAGREGFVVLNHNFEDFDRNNRFHSTGSDLALKFYYTFRF